MHGYCGADEESSCQWRMISGVQHTGTNVKCSLGCSQVSYRGARGRETREVAEATSVLLDFSGFSASPDRDQYGVESRPCMRLLLCSERAREGAEHLGGQYVICNVYGP